MKRNVLISVLIVLLGFVLVAGVQAAGHGHKKEMKKGILLVAFGTSIPEAQAAFENIDQKVKAAFPDIPVRWAYTSSIIRHKLAKEGKQLDSVEMALAKMLDENFTHIAVQSLHTIGGEEYHDLVKTVQAFGTIMGGFDRIILGYPLLAQEEDMLRVTDAMLQNIPKERKPKEAVVYMGHGTPHPSNAFYAAMMYHMQQKDPNIFVATVEGSPGIDEAKAFLLEKKIKTAYLIPFMAVAGDHARNDMAGPEEDSWKSILTAAGIQCKPILKGTAEYDGIVDVWVDHLQGVLNHFE